MYLVSHSSPRPPGHHSQRAAASGFCVFNSVAIAAEYAKQKHGLHRCVPGWLQVWGTQARWARVEPPPISSWAPGLGY
jgi:histone deacetylase 10